MRLTTTSFKLPMKALRVIAMLLVAGLVQAAQAQTFSVIHTFSGGADGAAPYAGLTMDRAGNFYGTTYRGGSKNLGAVYQLKHSGSGWIAAGLYSFVGGPGDGSLPMGRVIFGPDGSLYGTANAGGRQQDCGGLGCGMVFKLHPPATFCRSVSCAWTETPLHFFHFNPDGSSPAGQLIFDAAGNLYGTTPSGGQTFRGTVYELTPSQNGWTETVVHDFTNDSAQGPAGGLVADSAGNLYGTTYSGGASNAGTIFRLTDSGSGWTASFPYMFDLTNGGYPVAGLVVDQEGNLYGGTTYGGTHGAGVIFELSPSGGGWTYSLLYTFTGQSGCPDDQHTGAGPWAALTLDAGGNLYGTTRCDGAHSFGNVFRLTPSGGGWTYTSLYDFTGHDDGAFPQSNVTVDASGNLYGTASAGGSQGHGVAWKIAP